MHELACAEAAKLAAAAAVTGNERYPHNYQQTETHETLKYIKMKCING
jgi:hypothetical protein